VASTDDLSGGLDDRLREMCASWLLLRERPDETTRAIVTQSGPSLLKLLEYSREAATALGDPVIAKEVLATIPLLESDAKVAAPLAKPWLEFAVRNLLNPDKALPRSESLQLGVLSILLRALHGSSIEPSLRQVWSVEAPKMSSAASGETLEKALPRIAGEILRGYSPSSLAEGCLALEVKQLLGGDKTSQLESLAASLTNAIVGFEGLPIAGKPQMVGPLASAVVLLSPSGFGRVTVFGTTDTARFTKLLASDEALTSGKSLLAPKSKYRALEVLAYLLIIVLGLVIAWYNPGYALLIVPLAGAAAAVTWRVLGRKD